MDTIFALASAPGKAGIAVIRISGRLAFEAAGHLCGHVPDARSMRLATFKEANGDILDTGMMLSFQKPASFTGEDVIELHLHGSVAVVSSVLRELGSIEGLRLAQPGEFTRRALENGKLDLAQVEGLADLIDSETEAQRRLAQKVFSGALGDLVEVWRGKLIRAAALIEATIDFADEDVPVDVGPEVAELLEHVARDLRKMVMGVTLSERIRQGFEVAIMGPPNVGKSTLLNMLAGRDAAITSEIAGTTRDVIEVRMDLGGLPVTLLDTAGLRETDDKVESIGIARAKERAERADLRVFLCDVSGDPVMTPMNDDLVLLSKGDLFGDGPNTVSGLTGQGVDRLIEKITSILSARAGEAGLATRERHRQAFQAAIRSIEEAQRILSEGPDLYDIASDEIRHAIASMEVVVGRVDVENLLDEIFASFCLGK